MNKYKTWYHNITENAKNRPINGYVERHHIIPRSLGGSDNKENLVDLTAREHFICHWLLTKMYTGESKSKMVYALNGMKRSNKFAQRYETKITSRVYENLKKEFSIIHSATMKGRLAHNKGVSASEEQKEKNNSLIASNWLNNNDEVLSALHYISDNWELKKSMDIIGIPADDDIYNLVSANLKVFEDLHINSVHLEKLGVIDADIILIDKVKAKPVDKRTVNRKIKLYQNIDTIENPKTITDKKNKAKLELFIIEAKKLKTLNEKTVNVAWNKQRCNSKKPSYYNLIDLLNHYHK